jgi:hypothetical protein
MEWQEGEHREVIDLHTQAELKDTTNMAEAEANEKEGYELRYCFRRVHLYLLNQRSHNAPPKVGSHLSLMAASREESWDLADLDDLPSLTWYSSSSDSNSLLSRPSIPQEYMLDIEDHLAVAPPVQVRAIYECPFSFLPCRGLFHNAEQWRTHADTHLQGHSPPAYTICRFCDMVFRDPNPDVCWGLCMNHTAGHYLRGDLLDRSKPDYILAGYAHRLGLFRDYDQASSPPNSTQIQGRAGGVEPSPGDLLQANG